jgi:nitrogen regulatory protein PII-like uncharacterized protein
MLIVKSNEKRYLNTLTTQGLHRFYMLMYRNISKHGGASFGLDWVTMRLNGYQQTERLMKACIELIQTQPNKQIKE